MKKTIFTLATLLLAFSISQAQEVDFEEYTLDNGLHVILHQDDTSPIVITSVMYQVGAKDENPKRTGFAHFFEHLLFEGTKNIERGEWFKIVSSNGGSNNANTNDDRTYYYEIFPSNAVELGLWMESERLLHPVINQIGVDTQNEVVKEEKRLRVDNQPYGNLFAEVKKNMFKKHPYRWSTIGDMEHLDAATLDEFLAFNEKFYVPNNATLVVAGDINKPKVMKMIKDYFGSIPRGEDIARVAIQEDPITKQIDAVAYDPNIQIPAIVHAYRTPAMNTRDARILDMISTILSDGKSSRLYKKLVDDKKMALQISAFNVSQQDYGMYLTFALPLNNTSLQDLTNEIDEEIVKIQTELISEREYEKLQNVFENNFVNANASIAGIAGSLATFQMLYGDINLINNEIDIYRSITREEIREAARKYLNANQRLRLEYLPKSEQ
ncbi:MAG: peptidase M16 [Flavobacteriaceae bacterium CG_4_8_14_3_um_filter_34_10]|nr:insulinase family protein [Flavobacteriia bacterium]OIP51285.1 MAG: peptidase M16 [Flavobacteriaceae bacterium CG2_30_34_30]PIQ18691.1 MAG: peptidase M16 [Flavobacteriaceae bacterium CG18_big_fil_WC_8_21_14_2_50_34_36]PIV48759.1 MAG: peptidase M16 [Flavobacteriaceae bacterium CG02_land_8_20_14_3_00_34_13]PIX09394.1 MAG: peptidase M16 [Flavobacteriaceae bacterium CG_4_8_14_3_um_filter_34_10]PIZ08134.1 MAG: peptidase M16 [Flavobacteriaceae bacterium CG_4_10_14_0_8_um_filter_34_31]PJC07030.1 